MRKASSDGADFVCLIGEEEYQEKLISVKNLKTGDQIKVLYNDIVAHFNSLLN
jgi:histidyl-tRNA synthetase